MISFIHRNVVNLFIVYGPDTLSRDLNMNFTLGDCLFEAVKLTENEDSDKFWYSGYSIELDAGSQFSLLNGEWGKNVVIFGIYNSSSIYADNKIKYFLVLGEGPVVQLDVSIHSKRFKNKTISNMF